MILVKKKDVIENSQNTADVDFTNRQWMNADDQLNRQEN